MSNTSQPQTQDEFVPWSRGAEELGIGRGSFYHLVDTGQIRELPGRSRRNRRFSLQDILAVKERRAQGKPRKTYKKRLTPVIVDWLKTTDIPAGLRLDQIVYNEMFLAEATVYQSWRKNNDHLSMGAFSLNRTECFGYIQLVPLDEQVILDILSGKRDETSIQPEEIRAYDKPGPYMLLAVSAAAHPDRPDLLYKILYKWVEFWIEQYPEQYIKKIYAQAVSEKGDRVIQMFRMAPRYDLAENAFELDLARPGLSQLVRKFQMRLKEKAPLPFDLQWHPPEEPKTV